MKSFAKTTFATLILFMSMAATVQAQKIGHFDYNQVMEKLPQMKIVESQIEALEKQLAKQLEGKQTKMQTRYQEVMQQVQAGTMSPQAQKKAEEELTKMQEDLQNSGAEAEKQLGEKRKELLAPILTQVKDVVSAVAKEKGLAYVLDISTLLYYEGGNDITGDIKKKLNITE